MKLCLFGRQHVCIQALAMALQNVLVQDTQLSLLVPLATSVLRRLL